MQASIQPTGRPVLDGEAQYGCWVVNADEAKIDGEWQYPCRVALPTAKRALPSLIDWPDDALVLPAIEPGPIPQPADRVSALLREETASKGVAGLIYLPGALDGAGLYVAAWEGPSGDAGWAIGAYGAYPTSVSTPAGRAYLAPEFKRQARSRRKPPAEDTAAIEEDALDEAAASAENTSQGSRPIPRSRSLEF